MGTRERRKRSDEADRRIVDLFHLSGAPENEVAIAAVGGFGRGELFPGSDLDILIIHSGKIPSTSLTEIVNQILYPLWDSGLKIDHSVRTSAEVRAASESDIKVISGLLDIRLICGSADLVAIAQSDALAEWRDNSKKRLHEFFVAMEARHERAGELAYLLEPDVKESRGGLRDVTALRLIAATEQLQIPMERVSQAESVLADVREALHISSGKTKDVLLFQEQDKVAKALEYIDADQLMGAVTQSARAINYLVEQSKYRFFHRNSEGFGIFRKKIKAVSVSEGISVLNREVVFDADVDFTADPAIGLRAAATAAQQGLPISRDSLSRYSANLHEGRGLLPQPWPREARELLISFIGAGESMIEIFESLDQEDVLFSWLPEWLTVRSLPQRNALHRHTVDRHMVETAVKAAALTRTVHRPDILLFSALFHDIGKGGEEDHSLKGERLILPIARRIGFGEADISLIQLLIRHHLLLSSTATRRDLDDPATITSVVEHIPDLQSLELLHALSIADGEATGRAAWSDWKASLVADLVSRVTLAISDNTIAQQPEITPEQSEIASKGELHIKLTDRGSVYALELIAPDKTGLLSIVSGVLNLLRLDVRSARTKTLGKVAVMEWIVAPDVHAPPLSEELLKKELTTAFKDDSKLHERLQTRIDAYAQLPSIPVPDPIVEVFNDAATDATIIEVRSHDRPALLYRIGDVISESSVDIRAAIVTTLGAEAIDTLYVAEISGGALTAARGEQVASQLFEALK